MTVTNVGTAVAAALVLAILVGGCSSSSPSSAPAITTDSTTNVIVDPTTSSTAIDEPPLIDGFAELELLEPTAAITERAPVFRWRPIPGAATYRLAIVDDAGPIWAWQGEATDVRLGGLAEERPAGFAGPVLTPGSRWSVVAVAIDGTVIAVSTVRVIDIPA